MFVLRLALFFIQRLKPVLNVRNTAASPGKSRERRDLTLHHRISARSQKPPAMHPARPSARPPMRLPPPRAPGGPPARPPPPRAPGGPPGAPPSVARGASVVPSGSTSEAARVQRMFIIVNTLFIAFGLSMVLVSLFYLFEEGELDSILSAKGLVSTNTVFVLTGLVTIILGSFGAFAASVRSRTALFFYSVLISVVFFLVLSIVILSLNRDLKVTLMMALAKNLEDASPDTMTSLIFWNHLQLNDHCCGFGAGNMSWTIWLNNEYINPNNKTDYLPESCCGRSNFILAKKNKEKKLVDLKEGLEVSPAEDRVLPKCRSNSTDLYRADCFEVIFNAYNSSSKIMFGTALVFAFVIIMCFSLSIWMFRLLSS